MSKICHECAKSRDYGGCCVVREGGLGEIPLTLKDVQRISELTLLPPSRFVMVLDTRYKPDQLPSSDRVAYLSQLSFPTKIVLQRKPNGECIFLLDGKGCMLSSSRPRICYMYPFWYMYSELSMELVSGGSGVETSGQQFLPCLMIAVGFGDCLAVDEARRDDLMSSLELGVLRRLGMERVELDRYGDEFLTDYAGMVYLTSEGYWGVLMELEVKYAGEEVALQDGAGVEDLS